MGQTPKSFDHVEVFWNSQHTTKSQLLSQCFLKGGTQD